MTLLSLPKLRGPSSPALWQQCSWFSGFHIQTRYRALAAILRPSDADWQKVGLIAWSSSPNKFPHIYNLVLWRILTNMGWGNIYQVFFLLCVTWVWHHGQLTPLGALHSGRWESYQTAHIVIPKVGSQRRYLGLAYRGTAGNPTARWLVFTGECAIVLQVPWSSTSLSR